MDEFNKFGDIEILEVEPIDSDDDITSVSVIADEQPKSEEQVQDAITKLSKKYNLDLNNVSVKNVLDNIDNIDADDGSFDLLASKIVSDYVGKVALKAVISETNMINKVLMIMDNTPIERLDADSLLILSKVFEYQDRLFSILDRYKKTGVEKSLKHLKESKEQDKEKERISLTPDEVRRIVNEINRQKEEKED